MTSDFLSLHRPGDPLLMPNAFDAGSAKVLASMGFAALATTSSGFAATLGRRDGEVSRDEAIAHAAALTEAAGLPINADLENGFAATLEDVAHTYASAHTAGIAAGSIEDFTGDKADPIFDAAAATERVRAAVEAKGELTLTARAENYLYDRADLADTIARLQSFQEAGADVLYAPGMRDLDEIATLCREVDRPVNVLLLPGGPEVAQLAEAGVARISVGGAFLFNAYAGLVEAADDLLAGSTAYFDRLGPGRAAFDRATEG
ncbi:isocitrate lyase/phosphoenolpyruvate mutase family protein [Nocardioides humilatus]|uniref:Isocitrate lyase/phosphoenolpyruvate mutase family protein n=1 Tax=Nocardioides humilatus TaxID=2607660 RepID=A0A5B1LI47_9ACTN|nr:isocitrate lyase/phosphoenolpyruvate mutase family protein [Nocardioides humilatus]KAA1419247.1 isocitrate lyase/phosphoenolpyruvate mutase family protein [Nocardioides humilatus]